MPRAETAAAANRYAELFLVSVVIFASLLSFLSVIIFWEYLSNLQPETMAWRYGRTKYQLASKTPVPASLACVDKSGSGFLVIPTLHGPMVLSPKGTVNTFIKTEILLQVRKELAKQ